MPHLHIDFETRSTVDLRKTGVYPYAEHESTSVLCMGWAIDDEPVRVWVPGQPIPAEIVAHVEAGHPVFAHNAQFERVIWALIMVRRHGAPRIPLEQWHCTAAMAAAMALPRHLAQAAEVLGLPAQKDAEGHKLMLQMCKPRKPRKGEDPAGVYWWDEPEKLERLIAYCVQDVEVERELTKRLMHLGKQERQVYMLDQRINDRGVLVDHDLVSASRELVEIALRRANAEMLQLTDGSVESVTKVADLTRWLQDTGLEIDDVRKDTLRDLLVGDEEMPEEVRRVVELRSESAKSSNAKLEAMTAASSSDGRVRGLLLYHGASTGRWSGRLVQPQNFPRPTVKNVERFIPLVLAGDYDEIEAEAPVLVVISSLLRSMFRAAPGHQFMAGDFSQIEARVLAWIAEQDDLVDLFASGGKVYEEMAAFIYGLRVDEIGKDSVQRQVGKGVVLGAGFQMGGKTFAAQVKVQTGIDLPEEEGVKAIAGYRSKYPKIPQFWYDIEKAAIRAVKQPGTTHRVGRADSIKFSMRGQFLWCVLPSGRPLAYAKPLIQDRDTPWGETKECMTFMGQNSYTRKWVRMAAYGGLLTENVVQAIARDLIAAAMLRLDAAGYRPVLSVHDEVVGEPPVGHGSLEEFCESMKARPRWAAGLPVAVDGWAGERYRK